MFTSVFELFGQQQFSHEGESHHQHGHVGRTQTPIGQPHQAVAPQQQAHIEIQIPQLH